MPPPTRHVGRQIVLSTFLQTLEVREFSLDDPGPDEVLVRVDLAGVCGSDVHTWKGEFPRKLPMLLGHEGVGTVLRLDERIATDSAGNPVREGDRVYWAPALPCRRCYQCTVANDTSSCPAKVVYGPVGLPSWNSYATLALLPRGMSFYRIPDGTPSEAVIAFGCALPTVLQAIERLGAVRAGAQVVVQGAGPVGLAAVAALRDAGAGRITVLDLHAGRLELARALGADQVVRIEPGADIAARIASVRQLCAGRGADIVVEASGAIAAFDEGIRLLANGGSYLVVGLWAGNATTTIEPSWILRNNLRIIGSAYTSERFYHRAIQLAERRHASWPLADMIHRDFGLTDLLDAFRWIEAGGRGKAVVEPQRLA